MALRVWLPLTGNLENKGISDITVTNNGATVDNNGKIGKCYNLTNGPITLSKLPNPKNISVAFWFKRTANTGTRQFMFTAWNGVTCELQTDGTPTFAIYRNNYPTITGSPITTSSGWVHYCGIFNEQEGLKLYINGSLVKQNNDISPINWGTTSGQIGKYGSYASMSALINDFRIYDHALSAKEVKEISQGLVLHYKLDNPYSESTENLLQNFDTNFETTPIGVSTLFINQMGTGAVQEVVTYAGKKCLHLNSAGSTGRVYRTLSTLANKTYTLSCDYLCSTTKTDAWKLERQGGDYNWAGSNRSYTTPGKWQKLSITVTNTSNTTFYFFVYGDTGKDVYVTNFQIEEKDHATPYTKTNRSSTIKDSSGYGNDGIVEGNISFSTDTPRYNYSTFFNNNASRSCGIFLTNFTTIFEQYTISLWVKDSVGSKMSLGSNSSLSNTNTDFYLYGDNSWRYVHGGTGGEYYFQHNNSATIGQWIHYGIVYNGSNVRIYRNGTDEGNKSSTGTCIFNNISLGVAYSSASYQAPSYLSDFRLYATALSAEDILELYHTPASIDNSGNLHGFELEDKKHNILFPTCHVLTTKDWNASTLLRSYTQSNCQVTLTENGLRIYRPANYNPTNNGNTMWGGMRLANTSDGNKHVYNSNDNPMGLQKGHTYIIIFKVKGKSSNAISNYGWTNQMGWGGGGLSPSPSNIEYDLIPANFNGEKICWYKWTINDEVVKTCTASYSYATQGNQYMSYADFAFGWRYQDTGSMGSDIYITDIQMYDITDDLKQSILKNGVIQATAFWQESISNILRFLKGGFINTNNLIEK